MNTTTTTPRFRLEIIQDNDPFNPRVDCDNFGKMICWHRHYNLGDKHDYSEPEDFLRELVDKTISPKDLINYMRDGRAKDLQFEEDLEKQNISLMSRWHFNSKWYEEYSTDLPLNTNDVYLKDKILEYMTIGNLRHFAEQHNIIIPLYLYDHSGITISTGDFNDPWDSGQVGWIYASYEDIVKEYGDTSPKNIDKARKLLIAETKTYNYYLRSECYGYKIYENDEEIDSCWGFLGDFDEAKEAMKEYFPEQIAALIDGIDYFYPILEYDEN
jgi:hypothetical protein